MPSPTKPEMHTTEPGLINATAASAELIFVSGSWAARQCSLISLLLCGSTEGASWCLSVATRSCHRSAAAMLL